MADVASGRTFEITKSASFPDAVVWNPWRDKAASMADFGDDEYKVGSGIQQDTLLCDHCTVCM